MPTDFSGKWVSVKKEGWKEYWAKFDFPASKIPEDLTMYVDISQNGDRIITKTSYNIYGYVKERLYEVGSNHTDEVMPGVKLEFTTAWDGSKLVMKEVSGNGSASREIVDGQMVVTFEHDGAVSKIFYNKA